MRINSVPDVKCFYNNKNVLRAQSMVWHFVHHPVCSKNTKQLQISKQHLRKWINFHPLRWNSSWWAQLRWVHPNTFTSGQKQI